MTDIKTQKSNLAKLMATENITVIHKKIPTAYFDVKNRILACPTFKEDMSNELYDLFMGHEVGHALYTPYEGLHSTLKQNRTLKGYLNVIEDVRIEKGIRNKYAGLRKSFFKAYDELMQRDFFGLKGRDLQTLALIDKINLITKCGSRVSITLNEEETEWLKKAESCKTWEDVVEVSEALYNWSKENETRDEEDKTVTTQQIPDFEDDEEEYIRSGAGVSRRQPKTFLNMGGGAGQQQAEQMLMMEYVKYKNKGGTLSFEQFVKAVMQAQQEQEMMAQGAGMEQPQPVAMAANGGRMGKQEGGIMDAEASEMIDMGGMEKDYRETGGFVEMGGKERADDVPARLSKNEFVFTADAVRNAGGGDIDKGAEVMENLMNNLEQGGEVSEDSQGLEGAQAMYDQQQMLQSRIA